MKKISYILGIISIIITVISVIFKANHWSGANILLIVGLPSFALLFLTTSLVMLLKSTDDKILKLVYVAGYLSFGFDFIGMLFKILHWPGAEKLLIIGIPLPFVLFLPVYLYYHSKRKLESSVGFAGIMLFMIYLGVFSSLLSIGGDGNRIRTHVKNSQIVAQGNEVLKASFPLSNQSQELMQILEQLKSKTVALALQSNEKCADHELCDLRDYEQFCDQINIYAGTYSDQIICQKLLTEILHYTSSKENMRRYIAVSSVAQIVSLFTDWQNRILFVNYYKTSNLR